MDAYSMLPSGDVADYLKNSGYVFNPIEIAWLIDRQTAIPITEKNALYMEIINCCPDMEFHKSVLFRGGPWLHEYLKALISWNNGAIHFLCEKAKNTTNPYVYELCGSDRDNLGLPLVQYDSFEDAFLSVQPYWDKIRSFQLRNDRVRFLKTRKNKTRNSLYYDLFADVNSQAELLWFSAGDRLILNGMRCPGELCTMEIFLPVPFEPGDIVTAAGRDGAPLLLKTLPQKEMSGMSYQYYYDNAHTPAYATFYYLTADGKLADSFPHLGSLKSPRSTGWGYPTSYLEYYKEDLNGVYSVFPSLSSYIKRVGIAQFMEEAEQFPRRKLQRAADAETTDSFFIAVAHELENRRLGEF